MEAGNLPATYPGACMPQGGICSQYVWLMTFIVDVSNRYRLLQCSVIRLVDAWILGICLSRHVVVEFRDCMVLRLFCFGTAWYFVCSVQSVQSTNVGKNGICIKVKEIIIAFGRKLWSIWWISTQSKFIRHNLNLSAPRIEYLYWDWMLWGTEANFI